jgi:beta-N-acetylhexosaminidase
VLVRRHERVEGRGTTRPFELLGAPWVVAERFAEAMNRRDLPGVYFRPAVFEPTFHKHAASGLRGAQPHVLDRQRFGRRKRASR